MPLVRASIAKHGSPVPSGQLPKPGERAADEPPCTPVQRHAMELILGGLTLRMMPTLEALHLDEKLPLLGGAAPSYFHLVLLAHAMILRGPDTVAALLLLGAAQAGGKKTKKAAAAPETIGLDEVVRSGLGFYGMLWTDQLVAHARKFHVAHHMMRKYSEAHEQFNARHPCVIPGFMVLQPQLGKSFPELRAHVCAGQSFPQWKPPGPLGDWERIE